MRRSRVFFFVLSKVKNFKEKISSSFLRRRRRRRRLFLTFFENKKKPSKTYIHLRRLRGLQGPVPEERRAREGVAALGPGQGRLRRGR